MCYASTGSVGQHYGRQQDKKTFQILFSDGRHRCYHCGWGLVVRWIFRTGDGICNNTEHAQAGGIFLAGCPQHQSGGYGRPLHDIVGGYRFMQPAVRIRGFRQKDTRDMFKYFAQGNLDQQAGWCLLQYRRHLEEYIFRAVFCPGYDRGKFYHQRSRFRQQG